jgi:hypothetical protein
MPARAYTRSLTVRAGPTDARQLSGSGAGNGRRYDLALLPACGREGVGRFAHLHGNAEVLLEPADVEGKGQVDFTCPECADRASIVFPQETARDRHEHARRMSDETRRWGRRHEERYWNRALDDERG